MTVLVGIVENGNAYMAADSICIVNHHVRVPIAPKIHRFGAALVGLTGNSAYRRALTGMPDLLNSATRADTVEWVEKLADRLRAWGTEQGHGQKDGNSLLHPTDAIIATPFGLWTIGQDGAVTPILPADGPPQWAIGVGQDIALGALYALAKAPVYDRLSIAVEAACAISAYCALPVRMEMVRAPDPISEGVTRV